MTRYGRPWSAGAGGRGEQGSCTLAACQITWEPQIMAATAPPHATRAAFAPAPLPPLTMRPAAEIHYRCGTRGNQHVPAAGQCRRSGLILSPTRGVGGRFGDMWQGVVWGTFAREADTPERHRRSRLASFKICAGS